MQTPITKAIKEFERLKDKAPNLRDALYLDAVLAVLDSMVEYEKEFIEHTHMAGQKDAGVDPSSLSALAYYDQQK